MALSTRLADIRAAQIERVRAGIESLLQSNRFYQARLHRVTTWDDFERLPLTTKHEITADQQANPPFGTNLTFPIDRYSRLHQTSGTSGTTPLRWLDTPESWDWWVRIWAEDVYRSAGVGASDRVFFAFSFGPFIGFWSAFDGADRLGALVIPGGAMTTEQRLLTMLELRATVLCSTPTYAIRMAEVAQAAGIDLAASDIRITVHAGEPGASIPATRDLIERSFGAQCFDHTGMTELGPTGVSCDARDGVHLIESEFVFEVRDDAGTVHSLPDTGTITGELVATNLGRWGSPLIRYRTGDRVELTREPCSCGSPFAKMLGGIRGRVDDMFTVRGVNLYPSQVEDLVRRHAAIGEFCIEVRQVRGMDEVTILCECQGDDGEAAVSGLANDLRLALGARIECRQVAAGSLPRSDLKSRRLRRV
ncbi:MAG TPA: phenylacetate--CoA ligase family protein [Candidatus Dormibacteraeota bacterium]|nr:phenylacetate--CoA ligase family protein [Candidatus Dormibacteraeota bacterium]